MDIRKTRVFCTIAKQFGKEILIHLLQKGKDLRLIFSQWEFPSVLSKFYRLRDKMFTRQNDKKVEQNVTADQPLLFCKIASAQKVRLTGNQPLDGHPAPTFLKNYRLSSKYPTI